MSSEKLHVGFVSLETGAATINQAAARASEAQCQVSAASNAALAFGGEAPQGAVLQACADAERALKEIASVAEQLSGNVAAAAYGYLTTDEGVIPIDYLVGRGFAL